MALNIKNSEAGQLARELARTTGESLTEAVIHALRERLEREAERHSETTLREEIWRIQERVARLPVLDPRSADEIIGYDEYGLPS